MRSSCVLVFATLVSRQTGSPRRLGLEVPQGAVDGVPGGTCRHGREQGVRDRRGRESRRFPPQPRAHAVSVTCIRARTLRDPRSRPSLTTATTTSAVRLLPRAIVKGRASGQRSTRAAARINRLPGPSGVDEFANAVPHRVADGKVQLNPGSFNTPPARRWDRRRRRVDRDPDAADRGVGQPAEGYGCVG